MAPRPAHMRRLFSMLKLFIFTRKYYMIKSVVIQKERGNKNEDVR
jgi:hypothetical protein